MVYHSIGKRLLDLLMVIGGAPVWLPLMLVIGLVVRLWMGRPALFRQVRPGRRGRPFTLLKFRTMTEARDAQGNLLPDAQRLTPLGRFLRSTSLDELPELWNVLKGDMSLVGPRPLLMRYTPYFSNEERQRFLVRPGITGLAQVSGRNSLSWHARLAEDVRYVQQGSLSLDLRILFLTLWCVLSRKGLQVNPASAMLDLDVERRLNLEPDHLEASSNDDEQ